MNIDSPTLTRHRTSKGKERELAETPSNIGKSYTASFFRTWLMLNWMFLQLVSIPLVNILY